MAKRGIEELVAVEDDKNARREAKRLRKAQRAPREVEVSDHVKNDGVGAGEEPDLRKANEKAMMKAAKEQRKSKVSLGAAQKVVSSTPDTGTDLKAERKTPNHAEKAARKASKTNVASGVVASTTGHGVVQDGKSANTQGAAAYEEDSALAALPQADIDAFISRNHLSIDDPEQHSYRPIVAFKHLPGYETQQATFASFAAPTPIQAACWPYLFAGRDLIGVAETGSGKTLAFGVPCVRHISRRDKKNPRCIKACMVSPTRELALQIHEQMVRLADPMGLKAVCVYGGVNKDDQRKTLQGAHIVIATPGRLNDFINEGSIDLSNVDYLVLDEADRMLDKGFEDEVRKIISATLPTGRQTLMFTATWPQSVRDLASTLMSKPIKVTIGDNASGELRANTRITQEVEVMQQFHKQDRLIQILKQYQSGKKKNDRILVFCLYKKESSRIEEFIRRKGFNVAGIHGDLSQPKRTESLEAFKSGKVPLLVATDVAARGLDIPAVKLVINVTFPLTVEDYVHRIGRTGRAGQDGKAITFFTDAEKGLAGALINVLKAASQPVPDDLMKFGTTVKPKQHSAYGAFFKETNDMPKATKVLFD